ncbi:MAG: phage tail protein I [Fusobacterium sp.]|nr:phage tail protein I [Fusobacterium sp.]MDO5789034.1 phage tail protein I [Fusobacterium sp.]
MILKTIYGDNLLKQLAPQIVKNSIVLEVAEKLIKKHLINNIKYLVFIDRIGEMEEEELDYVADELHVDYYDYTMSLSEKRKACQEFLIIHSLKGTIGGIKKALNIFFENSNLEEWYQYNGEVGYFRVKIDGTVPSNLQQIKERVENVKKKSQHLEKLIFLSGSQQDLFYGIHMMHGKKSSIYPARVSFQFRKTDIEVQTGISVVRIVKEGER